MEDDIDGWVVLDDKPIEKSTLSVSPPPSTPLIHSSFVTQSSVVPSAPPSTEYYYPPIDPNLVPEISSSQSPAFTSVSPNSLVQPSAPPTLPVLQPYPQHYINFANFRVNEQTARDIFRQWRDERWFAPSDFQNLKEGQLYAFLVPYYQYSVTTCTSYSGKIGFYQTSTTRSHSHTYSHQNRHNNHNHNHNQYHESHTVNTQWHPASGCATGSYPNMLVCASVVNEDVRLLSAIDNWDLSQVVCTLSYQNQLGPAKDWKECWMKALQQIKLQEKVKAGSHLLSSNGADTVDNVHVDVEITQFQYQLVYFPVYYYGYTFSGQ